MLHGHVELFEKQYSTFQYIRILYVYLDSDGCLHEVFLPFLNFHNSLQFTSFNFILIHYNKHLINAQRQRYLKISSFYKLLLTARDFYSLITRWRWLPFSTTVISSSSTLYSSKLLDHWHRPFEKTKSKVFCVYEGFFYIMPIVTYQAFLKFSNAVKMWIIKT